MSKISRRLFRYFTTVSLFLAGTAFLVFVVFMVMYRVFQDEREIHTRAENVRTYLETHLETCENIHEANAFLSILNDVIMADAYFIRAGNEKILCSCGCGCELADQPAPPPDIKSISDTVFADEEYHFSHDISLGKPLLHYAG